MPVDSTTEGILMGGALRVKEVVSSGKMPAKHDCNAANGRFSAAR
jgi:hypothetical protein